MTSSSGRNHAVSPVGMVNGFQAADRAGQPPDIISMLDRRSDLLGPGYQLFYADPIEVSHARDVFLYGRDGIEYLDAYNNVAQIGHCHPKVVEAVSRQLGILNTNTRYLQSTILETSEELLATFPGALNRVTYTCSGSEANDLAVRIANYHTGATGLIATKHAYHGVTSGVAAFSPSLGTGSPPSSHVRLIDPPDPRLVGGDESLEDVLRANTRMAAEDLHRHGHGVSAFIADSVFSSDGVFTHPTPTLGAIADEVRRAGGLVIADEVQAGFGRTGDGWWGFQRHRFEPDIVTLGKPMGNGYPVAGVVLREEVGREFAAAVRYFNTFGGSTAAMAATGAVLAVIKEEDLVDRARTIGGYLRRSLRESLTDIGAVAQVRGVGMFYGIEICGPDGPSAADADIARTVVNEVRRDGVLISASGPGGNVLKIRPPLTFRRGHVDRLVGTLTSVLRRTPSAAATHGGR
ncbi:aspartate aminotransferase family protein [Actinomadura welshii]|uniref:aspartate aminotransferase family protein n=1 Tax=Actinomadura welshii TaxID=3103817 RepID=UPI0003AD2B87|nr:aminotransferase class III-fold pyridoxal phosphate-dependent enzyme [Actinomadura madurae]